MEQGFLAAWSAPGEPLFADDSPSAWTFSNSGLKAPQVPPKVHGGTNDHH